ncbi:hypothetical protein DW787_04790 [Collinsella intestinalis]|uniref:Uncharacterized protein n=1 Tax=Collinsella intestinalis TaxID=147207 RepID=A0A414FX30_9ACTN|nr:hypothetical protein DW787_04790 [Collinsella intestinalis]
MTRRPEHAVVLRCPARPDPPAAAQMCEPFLLPPDTEKGPPRTHHPYTVEQPASQPPSLVQRPARRPRRAAIAAVHGITAAPTNRLGERASARRPFPCRDSPHSS